MSAPRKILTRDERVVHEFTFAHEVVEGWHDEERAVLGAVLLDNSVLAAVRGVIEDPSWFRHPAHPAIWESVCAVADAGHVVNVMTLGAHLRERAVLNAIGGAQYLGVLTDTIPTVAHAPAHARLVANAHRLRAGVSAALAAIYHGAHGDLPRLRARLAESVEACADREEKGSMRNIGEMIAAQFERIEGALANGIADVQGLPYHLPTLNAWTSGMHGGELIVIAARPGTGKSAWLEQLCIHVAREDPGGGAVLYFSQEMNHREWIERALACEAEVDIDVVKARTLATQDQLNEITAAANRLHGLPVFVDDASRQTPATIRARALEIQRTHGLALLVVDYLQLVEADVANDNGRRGPDNRAEEVARITRAMKKLAKDLGVPVVLAAQLNRESEKGGKSARPRLANLRESGAVEQDANVVMFLHRTGDEESGGDLTREIALIVEKSRNSRTGDIATLFRGNYQRFYEGEAANDNSAARDARVSVEDESFRAEPRRQFGRAYDGARGAIEAPAEDNGFEDTSGTWG